MVTNVFRLILTIGCIVQIGLPTIAYQTNSSLYHTSLRFIPSQLANNVMGIKMNSSGFVIETTGTVPEIINWLSLRFRFSYSYLPAVASLLVDDSPGKRGKISYLREKEADCIVGAILPTNDRFKDADFPSPWMYSSFSILIPFPKPSDSTNMAAMFLPWSAEVWIGFCFTLPITILSIYGVSKLEKKIYGTENKEDERILRTSTSHWDYVVNYVIYVLLSQGSCGNQMKFATRCIAAAWCLTCFVLVQTYSCKLISFITLPNNNKPIINSVYDIPNVPGLQVVVNRGLAAETALLEVNLGGVFKHIRNSLMNDQNLHCNATSACLDLVRTGSFVYIHGLPIIKDLIIKEKMRTGTCQFMRSKESFWQGPLSFALAKNSPYLESFNQGLLELWDFGLLDHWNKKNSLDESECSVTKRKETKKDLPPRLTMKNLSGPFVILIAGSLLSLMVFIVEKLVSYRQQFYAHRSRSPARI